MDLIERLNDAWRKLYGDGDEHDVCDTIAEAAAALEAAQEDVGKVIRRIEQYADDQKRDPIVVPPARLRGWATDLRQAIDRAPDKESTDEA